MVEAGEWFDLVVIFSSDSVLMQFLLERRSEPPPGAAGGEVPDFQGPRDNRESGQLL